MFMCHMCAHPWGSPRLELQMVVSYHVGLGTEPGPLEDQDSQCSPPEAAL